MDDTFRRDYLVRLPLPLAQLYSRAHNAKQARSRHDNAFYLCEALIKLSATPAILTYLQDTRRGDPRCTAVDGQLDRLTLPSLGHWLGFLRELANYFGERVDAASHPFGHLRGQLNSKRKDWGGVLNLYRRIKNGPDGQPVNCQGCSAMELFDALVQYRNTVFGHGASRAASFYEEEMGPLLLPAISDLLDEGVLDVLGPRGSRLVFLTEIRSVGGDRMEVEYRELTGRESERAEPIELSTEEASTLAPNCVAVKWPGTDIPQRLDPLLTFRETELTEEVLFLNRDRSGKQIEYLSYTTGQTVRDREMGPALRNLLAEVPRPEEVEEKTAQSNETAVSKATDDTSGQRATEGKSSEGSRRFRDFEILAELGRGGMGVVYVARQLSLGRLVALKTLSADLLGDDIALARFRREMRVLGRCDHSNIVKVYSCGATQDGQLYYAMEYVPGADLEQVWRELSSDADAATGNTSAFSSAVRSASSKQLEQTRAKGDGTVVDFSRTDLPVPVTTSPTPAAHLLEEPAGDLPNGDVEDLQLFQRKIATLIRDAAEALQVVHDQQIVHRDVKPANLILTADGSRVVLMDFGLAKGQSTTALTTTKTGGLLGTLRYSAPEQLASANVGIGPAADVRGLGATMWELLTKRRLFGEAEDERQLATWVLNRDLPLLRTINPALDADLEAITAKATDRNVESRIQRAGELAEYLDLYLNGKQISIGRPKRLGVLLVYCAIPIVIACALLPNGLAGVFNLLYNDAEIMHHLTKQAQQVFWIAQMVINVIAYPVGVFFVGLLAFKSTRPIIRQKSDKDASSPEAMASARKHSLLLGHHTAIIGVLLWSLAGLTYPIAIHSTSGDMPFSGYLHFFGSLVVCGMVAAAYPFFLITWFNTSTVYPLLSQGRVYATQDRATLEKLEQLNWRYFVCAVAVPLLAVSMLVMIDSHSRLALGVFAIGGLAGFGFAAATFRKIQRYLAAQM